MGGPKIAIKPCIIVISIIIDNRRGKQFGQLTTFLGVLFPLR